MADSGGVVWLICWGGGQAEAGFFPRRGARARGERGGVDLTSCASSWILVVLQQLAFFFLARRDHSLSLFLVFPDTEGVVLLTDRGAVYS